MIEGSTIFCPHFEHCKKKELSRPQNTLSGPKIVVPRKEKGPFAATSQTFSFSFHLLRSIRRPRSQVLCSWEQGDLPCVGAAGASASAGRDPSTGREPTTVRCHFCKRVADSRFLSRGISLFFLLVCSVLVLSCFILAARGFCFSSQHFLSTPPPCPPTSPIYRNLVMGV